MRESRPPNQNAKRQKKLVFAGFAVLAFAVLVGLGLRGRIKSSISSSQDSINQSGDRTAQKVDSGDPRNSGFQTSIPEGTGSSTGTSMSDQLDSQVVNLRRKADALAAKGRFAEAAEVSVEVSTLEIPDRAMELLRAFDWHLRAGDIDSAEADLKRALESSPQDPRVLRSLAELLNAEGRRCEASQHVLALARSGAITPRELLSLIDLNGPFQLVSYQEVVGDVSGTLLQLGEARHQLVAEGNLESALQLVDQISTPSPNLATEAFRARLLAEKMDQERFQSWLNTKPDGIEQYSEYWLAIGLWLSQQERDAEAVRAFAEALRIDPTDRRSLRSIVASLSRLGEYEKSKQVRETLEILDSIFRMATSADPNQAMEIAGHLDSLLRPWESAGWYRYAFEMQGNLGSYQKQLAERREKIRAWEAEARSEQILDARLKRMLGFDVRDYPLPKQVAKSSSEVAGQSDAAIDKFKFVDLADSIGITTTFRSDYPLDQVDFFLHQANGGGLAAFDYDLDGRCDLYVVQTGGDPNRFDSSDANQLFRQLPDATFSEISQNAGSGDRGYGQGVCVSDLNQDGFPDLLVANIGQNRVFINQGDGSFELRSDLFSDDERLWTSSLAAGDLNGDHLPDFIEVNYLQDPSIFERKCKGKQLLCTPQRFRAAPERIFFNVGDGTFRQWKGATEMASLPNYGFGAVIANFDDRFGNDVFISNDGDVNHFWVSSPASESSVPSYRLQETAGITGCGIGTSGVAQACMGIASGDFDRNGLLDLMITNFHNEPVNLFLQADAGIFVDEAVKYGLAEPSRNVLGFGAQAADFDNDGWLDLAISNGHIYDATYADIPFRMKSQVFAGSAKGFSLQDPTVAGDYWQREHLGRTLALFDWNSDGRMDLVANHLDRPIAVLENKSQIQNWLQMELVGVTSARDAVGAKVTVRAASQNWFAWQIGGDGYMCSNQPILHFGLGSIETIDEVEIKWPSGRVQTIQSLEIDRRYLIVEDGDAFVR